MEHTGQAREVARLTGWNLDAYATARGWGAVGIGPCGRSRDSESLEVSNYETAQAILRDAGARFDTPEFGHWAVGWVREIAHDAADTATVAAVASIRARLEDYPVLDEADYSDREWADNHPNGTRIGAYCYADWGDDCHRTDLSGRILPNRDGRGRFARY